MKRRLGFVSNSSSASFVVALNKITSEQLEKLYNWCGENGWSCHVDEEAGLAQGWTSMDNGELSEWLEKEMINNNPVRIMGD